jgi:hypothetical protein
LKGRSSGDMRYIIRNKENEPELYFSGSSSMVKAPSQNWRPQVLAAKDFSPAPTACWSGALELQDKETQRDKDSNKPRVKRQAVLPTEWSESSTPPCKISSVHPTPQPSCSSVRSIRGIIRITPLMRHALIQPSKIKRGSKPTDNTCSTRSALDVQCVKHAH